MSNGTRGQNRNSRFLLSRLKTMYGDDFEPVIKMAENANHMQNIVDSLVLEYFEDGKLKKDAPLHELMASLKETSTAWDKVGAYTNAKIRQIEISGSLEVPVAGKPIQEMSKEELKTVVSSGGQVIPIESGSSTA